jgi:peroxiredoxin
VAALVFAGVIIFALLRTATGGSQPAAPGVAREDASRPVAPPFTVPTIDGSTFSLNQQQGKVVVMYFMAGWCTTCYPEAQAMAKLYPHYRDKGVEMVAMDAQPGEGPPQLDAFRKRAGNGSYVWAFDQNLQVAQAYGVTALEHTVVIDRQGRIAFHDKVSDSQQKLEQEITALL